MPPPTPLRPSRVKQMLHVGVLCSFAFTYPMFDMLARDADFFVYKSLESADVVLILLALWLPIPVALLLIQGLAGRVNARWPYNLQLAFSVVLMAVIALPALKGAAFLPGGVLVCISLLVGLGFAMLYHKTKAIPLFLTLLSPCIVAFPLWFLLFTPAADIVFDQQKPPAALQAVGSKTPVVFVVFDEFPLTSLLKAPQTIDKAHFPHFYQLAQNATWYPNTYTVSDYTHLAVPAILSGHYPATTKLPTANHYPHNLFTLLGKTYEMHVHETWTRLCPVSMCPDNRHTESAGAYVASLLYYDIRAAFQEYLLPSDMQAAITKGRAARKPVQPPRFIPTHRNGKPVSPEASASQAPKSIQAVLMEKLLALRPPIHDKLGLDRLETFERNIQNIQATEERPALYFFHVLLPHKPYMYLPSGQMYLHHPEAFNKQKRGPDAHQAALDYQRHLLQTGLVDNLIGKLIARLKAQGLYDDALIVVTADHGISFTANDEQRDMSRHNTSDILQVPLFVKAPHQQTGEIDRRVVQTIDILPTVARHLQIDLPWPIDGRCVLEETPSPRPEIRFVHGNKKAKSPVLMLSTAHLKAAQAEALRRKHELFTETLQLSPPFGALLARPLTSLQISKPLPGASLTITTPSSFMVADLQDNYMPVYVKGHIGLSDKTLEKPVALATAVNQVVQNVTPLGEANKGTVDFALMLPQQAFQQGQNTVAFYLITGSTKQPQLHELHLSR